MFSRDSVPHSNCKTHVNYDRIRSRLYGKNIVVCQWIMQAIRTVMLITAFIFAMATGHAQTGFFQRLADSAATLTQQKVVYYPRYVVIDYPNGDVAPDRGVCTDVIIRSYRKMGIDLQKEVHEDMRHNFSAYPKNWGLTATNRSIDHRRVPNLMKFFERRQAKLPVTRNAADYQPGDVVCWSLGRGLTHIGLVVNKRSPDGKRHLIVHNIGAGQVLEDCLFSYTIIGHYRYGK